MSQSNLNTTIFNDMSLITTVVRDCYEESEYYLFQLPAQLNKIAHEISELHLACNIYSLMDSIDCEIEENYEKFPLIMMLDKGHLDDGRDQLHRACNVSQIEHEAFEAAAKYYESLNLNFPYQGYSVIQLILEHFKDCIALESSFDWFTLKDRISSNTLGKVAQCFYDAAIEINDTHQNNIDPIQLVISKLEVLN